MEPPIPGFSGRFLQGADVDALCDRIYIDVHTRGDAAAPRFTG